MTPARIRPGAAGFPPSLEALQAERLAEVHVALLDSGVDAGHPTLAGRVASAFRVASEGPEPRVHPVEAGADNDAFGHGTAVASIVAGIAPNARLVDVRVLEPGNEGTGVALVVGLKHAVSLRCPVVNMSLAAAPRFAAALQPVCDEAYRQGQVVVAAKRNLPFGYYGFPAEMSVAVSVDLETTPRLLHLLYRPEEVIEFAAHGEDVRVAAPGGGFTTMTGTSFATPVVSGICALLLGYDPSLRPFEVKTLLKAYAAS